MGLRNVTWDCLARTNVRKLFVFDPRTPPPPIPPRFGLNIINTSLPLTCVYTCQDKHNWVLASIFFMELIAGVAMAIIGALLVIFRWPELRQVRRSVLFRMFLKPMPAA